MNRTQKMVLVVDDERSIVDLLYEDLSGIGYNCVTTLSGEDALLRLSTDNFDVMLLDLKLPGISGLNVLKEVKSMSLKTRTIVVTASDDAPTAVEAMKMGAIDYITKPFELEEVNNSIALALQVTLVGDSRPGSEREADTIEKSYWMRYLDDIAEGVEAKLNSLTGHVINVTIIEQTIEAARRLEIPEEHITKWTDDKRKHVTRINVLGTLIEQVSPSPVAWGTDHALAHLYCNGCNTRSCTDEEYN